MEERSEELDLLDMICKISNFEVKNKDLGSVVQSIASLTSSLRGQLVKCFTTL